LPKERKKAEDQINDFDTSGRNVVLDAALAKA
jgi:hypothetical protein